MGLDITEQLGDSITNFKTLNAAISKSKQNTTATIKYLESILKKLLKLIEKAYDIIFSTIAEGKFIESKAGTAVKDKKTMHDLLIAFDDHVDHASRIMESPPSASRKKKIKEALKQAEDVLFSMTKHQDKMKENEARFHAALPTDSKTSKNQAANHNFRTIGKEEKTMDLKQYFAELNSMTQKFVDYRSELDKQSKDGYDAAQIGLSRDEQRAWSELQENPSSYFDENGNHVVVNQKNKETTVTTPDEKKITVNGADGTMISVSRLDDEGNIMVEYADESSLLTYKGGKTKVATDKDGKKIVTTIKPDNTTVVTQDDNSFVATSEDGLTVIEQDRHGKSSTTVINATDGSYVITDNDTKRKDYFNSENQWTGSG